MSAVPEDIGDLVSACFGAAPDSVERLTGGANNICLRVTVSGRPVVAKIYFTHAGDRRDRLGAEYGMLSFLWANGIRCIPEPLAEIPERRVGFYEFVEGVRPLRGEITRDDGFQMADLLMGMHALRSRPGAAGLPPGSDAAFRLQDYLDCVQKRVDRVRASANGAHADAAFHAFVVSRVESVWPLLCGWVGDRLSAAGLDAAAVFSSEALTLNPADHGFHNALRREAGGRLVFLDFEYAGWDDPAQMLCNALLQPEVPLPEAFRRPFLKRVLGRMPEGQGADLVKRMRIVYPVLCFKWAMIMLNEFLPVDRERRRFSGADTEHRRREQLQKAATRLAMVEMYLKGAGELFDGL